MRQLRPSDCEFRDVVRLSVCKKCAERMKSNSDGTGREVRAFRPAIARQNSLDKGCSLNIGCEISVVRSRQGNTSRDKSAAVVAAVDNWAVDDVVGDLLATATTMMAVRAALARCIALGE